MRNLGNPRCHFTKYGPSCKFCRYNLKVSSENEDHPEPIKIVVIKKSPKLQRITVSPYVYAGGISVHSNFSANFVKPFETG